MTREQLDAWLAAYGAAWEARDVAFRHEVLGVEGARGFARWWSGFDGTGSHFELDGVFVLDFAEDGLCTQLQEWWAGAETPLA